MTFVKVVKNKAYFKRFQTKFARRRSGKTDYRQRRALVVQDKNKYMTPKFRFVVRFTNRAVITQIVYTEVAGDRTICSAYSSELARYGLKLGLKNYSAAYCTGLLCARRLLQKLKLDSVYTGNEEVDGTIKTCAVDGRDFWVSEVDPENPRPMRALLDVGLRATSTGARVFAALKGASDGGLDIPHNEKRFIGYDREEKKYDPAAMRARIFGDHVCDYMNELKEEDPAKYNKNFASFIAAGVSGDDLEDLYAKVHAAIRADPKAKDKLEFKAGPQDKKKKIIKRNIKQRKNRVQQKKAWRVWKLTSAAAAAAESDSE